MVFNKENIINSIIALVIMGVIWIVTMKCNEHLSQQLSKEVIIIFTAFFYALFMGAYAYYNFDKCRDHFDRLDGKTLSFLMLIPFLGFLGTVIFNHTKIKFSPW